jgi:hypothetical protein
MIARLINHDRAGGSVEIIGGDQPTVDARGGHGINIKIGRGFATGWSGDGHTDSIGARIDSFEHSRQARRSVQGVSVDVALMLANPTEMPPLSDRRPTGKGGNFSRPDFDPC